MMRILIIDPFTKEVSERVVPRSGREIYSIVGSNAIVCTLLPRGDKGINFVLEKNLATTTERFSLGTKRVFTGRAVITGSESKFTIIFKGTTISVAQIRRIVDFFTAPRQPFGWLQ